MVSTILSLSLFCLNLGLINQYYTQDHVSLAWKKIQKWFIPIFEHREVTSVTHLISYLILLESLLLASSNFYNIAGWLNFRKILPSLELVTSLLQFPSSGLFLSSGTDGILLCSKRWNLKEYAQSVLWH